MSHRKLPRRGVHRAPATLRGLVRGAVRGQRTVADLQREAADAFAVGHAIVTGSGRRALTAILEALALSPGDGVLLPALTFHAVPHTIAGLGLRPVFADVDPETFLLPPTAVARHPDVRVVLATHLFGLVCDLDELGRRCAEGGARLVEDFAQAAGARWRERPVGSWGDAGFTSLETVKPLAAFGGGLVTTSDPALARRVEESEYALPAPDVSKLASKVALGQLEAALGDPRFFSLAWPLFTGGLGTDASRRSEGWIQRYKARKQGVGNHGARLHPAQAEGARRGLAHLDHHLSRRRTRAAELLTALGGRGAARVIAGSEPAWYQLVVRVSDAEACADDARRAGVDLGPGVATDLSEGRCPNAARLAGELVQLPCHPNLDNRDLARVAEVVGPWLA